MRKEIINEVKKSNSLRILRDVNNKIRERHFHEGTHILYDIRTLLGKEPKNYTEIGSYVGSSASLMLQHPFATSINCIDPLNLNPSHYKGIINQYDTLKKNIILNNIHNNSVKIFKHYSNSEYVLSKINDIDILFIDGCHKFKSVVDDFNNYKNKVNKGGFIIFDDYLDSVHSPEVRKAVDFIVKNINCNEYEIIGSIKNVKNAYSDIPRKNSNEFILYKKL